jgi:hypothetical protein
MSCTIADPGQQAGHDETDAFAGPRRREAKDVLGARRAEDIRRARGRAARHPLEEGGLQDLSGFGPAHRSVGRDAPDFQRPPRLTSEAMMTGANPSEAAM